MQLTQAITGLLTATFNPPSQQEDSPRLDLEQFVVRRKGFALDQLSGVLIEQWLPTCAVRATRQRPCVKDRVLQVFRPYWLCRWGIERVAFLPRS